MNGAWQSHAASTLAPPVPRLEPIQGAFFMCACLGMGLDPRICTPWQPEAERDIREPNFVFKPRACHMTLHTTLQALGGESMP